MPVAFPFGITCFFFFNDTATTEIYTLSLHDALPIWAPPYAEHQKRGVKQLTPPHWAGSPEPAARARSEEHTSELQSQSNLVCRLLLEKKKETETYGECPSHKSMTRNPHVAGSGHCTD